jgi:acetylornithine deacetylase/succinyl-diaminopimelate desuccinylase-like protein
MLHDTANSTGLRAGVKANVIPSEAEATVDGRLLPGTSVEDFLGLVRARLGPGFDIEVDDAAEPSEAPIDSPLFRKIDEVVRRHDPEGRAVPWLTIGFTDGANLARIGIRALGFTPCVLPPEIAWGKLFHGHNERVPVEGYRKGTRMLWDVVREWVAA